MFGKTCKWVSFQFIMTEEIGKGIGKRKEALIGILFMKTKKNRRKGR